ncbi:cell division protein FtsL [Hyphobacterium sp.]|jgi:cell division protein FtsL|uniref:cell division protein FtsL n=1 Tax=Hyphobacterium sp. TaxID=2004662 RepID=UPI003BAAE302
MIRALNVLAFIVASVLAVALYIAKTEAQEARDRLAEMRSDLAEERRQINVLRVDIAHLEDPDRLRALARQYLGFEPLDPSREVAMSDLPLLIEPANRTVSVAGQSADEANIRQAGGRP